MTSLSIARKTGLAAREWSRIRLGCTAAAISQVHVASTVVGGALAIGAMMLVARSGLTRRARHAAIALAPCTGLAAAVFRFTWGTPVYGLCERVVLGLGMCWISVLASRTLTRRPGRARWRT